MHIAISLMGFIGGGELVPYIGARSGGNYKSCLKNISLSVPDCCLLEVKAHGNWMKHSCCSQWALDKVLALFLLEQCPSLWYLPWSLRPCQRTPAKLSIFVSLRLEHHLAYIKFCHPISYGTLYLEIGEL